MKHVIAAILIAATVSCSEQKQLQNNEADAAVESLLNKQDYTFTVRTVLPSGRRSLQVTSQYDLRVSKDSLISYLPYFGRAYSAPIGETDGGFKFTSTDFQYARESRKKGGWLIKIKPNDNRDIQQMFLNITESGSASLQVTSTNRQPISYNGYIESRQK